MCALFGPEIFQAGEVKGLKDKQTNKITNKQTKQTVKTKSSRTALLSASAQNHCVVVTCDLE